MSAPVHNTAPAQPVTGRERKTPFLALLGAHCESAANGVATVALDLRPELCNHRGDGHGGVVMGLLDSAMAHAALSRLDDDARDVVAIDMHIGFMRPVSGRLVATGRATGGGKSVCFCEADIVDGSGAVVAKAMGTFRYRAPAEPKTETPCI